jgi:(2Fe-2S) ferredoxin
MSFYKHHVFFCTNRREDGICCQNHDAQALRDYAKAQIKKLGLSGQGKIRINSAGCLDRCSEGPCLVVYPDNVWYTYGSREDVDEIIAEHLQGGRPVSRLMI